MRSVTERFIEYAKINTQSDEESATFPSSRNEFDLAHKLYEELKSINAADVFLDEEHCYVYARIPATPGREKDKVKGFIAHMDTSPEISGENVNPVIIENYNGGDIRLGGTEYILSTNNNPELNSYVGKTLIVTDGTTLLGADNKAGIAEIMTMAELLLNNPSEYAHGTISICFTPDEEIGNGVDYFDMDRFNADFAYTVDGGKLGELEFENFNAASLEVTVHGTTVHPGEAKGKMINASRIACEFDTLLPSNERPENTSGYEGFYHLCDMEGSVEEAHLSYIIRDHSLERFNERKDVVRSLASNLNSRYGAGTVEIDLSDSYYNMRDKIYPDNMYLIDNVKTIMKKLGIEPIVTPIRGGTDGARLSYMGLLCPNLCAGGHNFHGRYEYVCVESMEKITELLTEISVFEY